MPNLRKNIQDSKTGNLGDILKHAALLNCANLIQSRNPEKRINYLDTHTYLIESACSNPNWRNDVANLVERFTAYKCYFDLESPKVMKGSYICSCGIALKTLYHPFLYLAEADEKTRTKLSRQLAELDCRPQKILTDMHKFKSLRKPDYAAPLLALVDPFRQTPKERRETFNSLLVAAKTLHYGSEDGIIIVFQYSEDEKIKWQRPPDRFTGPIAFIDRPPFHLVAYSTGVTTEAAIFELMRLGWQAA